jgi:hypothetical protein
MSQSLNLISEVFNLVTSVGCFEGSGDTDHCPGSVLHPVTAALATQGYWIQADILWHLRFTGFQVWAILIYLVAAIGAICGMAFGAPPKMWIWLLIGPGIFFFLIDTTTPAYGVRWYVGPNSSSASDIFSGGQQRDERAMEKVWKLSEVGLRNNSLALASSSNSFIGGFFGFGGDLQVYSDGHPVGNTRASEPGDPSGTVRVAWIFLWADWVFSDFVEWVVWWTGVFNSGAPASDVLRSNLPAADLARVPGMSFVSGVMNDDTREDDQAWLLSKNKWSYLMDITGAQLHNGDLRDAFVTMMSSECGDALRAGIDESSFVAAQNAKGMNLPVSVFKADTSGALYGVAANRLADTHIPTPPAVKALFEGDGQGSFRRALAFLRDDAIAQQWMKSGILENIACDELLNVVVEGFRWESSHIYYQLLTSLPPEMSPLTLMYTLFYGWDMKSQQATNMWDYSYFARRGLVTPILTPDHQAEFMQNLIFVHLFRNELQLAPKPFRGRVNEGQKAVLDVNTYQSRTGSRNKFGEVHTWSMMIPYIQGVLLYLLAMAYPFICLMVLMPGHHKSLFTWLSFFVWAKLWDVGFAVVMVLERSIWAMLGNGPNTGRVFARVLDMTSIGDYQVTCPSGFGMNPPYGLCNPGTVPDIMVGREGGVEQALFLSEILRYVDHAFTIGGNLQLDVANSYYIYIMSALYFAVPAVTGQMVLGARAGAAGLAGGAVSGLASESGKAAGQGYVGEQGRIGNNNNGLVGYNARNSSFRNGGLAGEALNAGNNATANDITGAHLPNDAIRQHARTSALAAGVNKSAQSQIAADSSARTSPLGFADIAARHGNNALGGIGAKIPGIATATGAGVDAATLKGLTDRDSLQSSPLFSGGGGSGSDSSSGEGDSSKEAVSQQSGGSTLPPAGGGSNGSPASGGRGATGSGAQSGGGAGTRRVDGGDAQGRGGGSQVSTNAAQIGNMLSGLTSAATNNATARIGAQENRDQAGYERAQTSSIIAAAGLRGASTAYRQAASSLQGTANAIGGYAAYGAQRNYQEGANTFLSTIGGGGLSSPVGNLSNSMSDLAGMGELGSSLQAKATLAMGGEVNGMSFFGYNDSLQQASEQNLGPATIDQTFNNYSGGYSNVGQSAVNSTPHIDSPLGNQYRNSQQAITNKS